MQAVAGECSALLRQGSWLSALWLHRDHYRPHQWLEQWITSLAGNQTGTDPSATSPTAPA